MKNVHSLPLASDLRRSASSRVRPLIGLTLLTLSLAACGTGTTPTTPQDASGAYYGDGQDHSWSSGLQAQAVTAVKTGDNYLSDLTWTSATNGWGPVEKDKSNGETGAGDGHTITINGKTYVKGLGVHAGSTITYNLNGQCQSFLTDLGVDDEAGGLGSVKFQVWVDGAKVYESPTLTGNNGYQWAQADLRGKNELKLVVTDAGNGISHDHADWGIPRVLGCTSNGTVAPTPTPAPTGSITYSGPIVITKGGTYTGNWESQNANVSAVTIQTSEPVVILNSNIRGRGNLIAGFKNRLTVRNSRGYGLNPNVAGRIAGKFINAEEIYSLTVENNFAEGTSGIYMRAFNGNASAGESIKILRNKFHNIDGRQSNGNNGFTTVRKITQAMLFNQVQRVPNMEIAWNQIINDPGQSLTEETINGYITSGTASSPLRIHDNYIQGAYNAQPWSDSAYSGGGILMNDGYTTDPSASGHTRVYNNQLVGLSNHSLNIIGGVDNQFYNNRIVASGFLPDGRVIKATTVGMVVWDINGAGKLATPTFWGNSMSNNWAAVTMRNADGSVKTNNPWWTPQCGQYATTCTGNVSGGTATLAMEQQEYQNWLNKLASNGVKVGP